MTIKFAAARSTRTFRNRLPGGRIAPSRAANDNPRDAHCDAVLHAALRHFAAHGLGAAANARDRALAAQAQGATSDAQWWHDICRKLDRRMAAQLHRRLHRRDH